jgi:hypothetical protein
MMEYNYQYIYVYPTGKPPEIAPNMIERLPDQAWVPNDPENTDWQAYQVWLAEGNTPLPPEGK